MSESKKSSSFLKPAAAVAAGALLLGGGTYALWSDSAQVDGGVITAGLLDVEATATQAQDVSYDRVDSPHDIDLTTWLAVPGDVVELTTGLDVALKGDNLVAALNTDELTAAIPEAAAGYVIVDAQLLQGDTELIPDAEGNYLLQANGVGQAAGLDDAGVAIVGDSIDGTADVTAKVTVTFSATTPDQVLTNATLAEMAEANVTLEQVREGTDNFVSGVDL